MDETEAALAEALAQTGFPFEHRIYEHATATGWIVIPNRLYVDAEEDKTREMDLLCYKAGKRDEVTVYTALLISCKVRTEKPWVLMTRPWPKLRPAWYPYPPVPTWTNSAALQYELGVPRWAVEYFDAAADAGLTEWAEDSREEVFALQEFDAARDGKGRPITPPRFRALNDTSLYMGAMSLLKALAYELETLGPRRGSQAGAVLYQFNLIQMLDGELYEASFGSGAPKVSRVSRYRYFARTMLNGKELSARIDFCTPEAIPSLLDDMAKLHRFNVEHFNDKQTSFYDGLYTDGGRLSALASVVEERLASVLPSVRGGSPKPAAGWLGLKYSESAGMTLEVDDFQVDVEVVNNDRLFMALAEYALKDLCRYEGAFAVKSDIPF